MNETAERDTSPKPPVRAFVYKHGDRPLDGYVIQRGAGRGGFGEVYYAMSDSGREVALKLVQTYEQIELRGISQCMNLKSPHLVSIFDVRYGNDGRPWVIMEYVNGPSLRQLLDEAPSGLGTQKAAFFLREIAKGLTYLHDGGIVHRDLKPANIFYEDGYVKIGDYGLSKVISTSQHSGQTVTVGTVHYMAPEIGVGNYDRGIDIYALGALLFEMLTGQVPFFGSSTGEVLMKHLGTNVDTTGIEEPFATVIRRAMEKDPTKRYQSVQEMVEAIFGAEHVRNSVSHFSPDSLTMVAGHAAQKISPSGSFTPSEPFGKPAAERPMNCDRWGNRIDEALNHAGRRIQDRLQERFGTAVKRGPQLGQDPLRAWPRIVLASMIVVLTSIAVGIATDRQPGALGIFALFATAWGVVFTSIAARKIAPAMTHEGPWVTRLAVGGLGGLGCVLFSMPGWNHVHVRGAAFALFAGFVLIDWTRRVQIDRVQQVPIGKLISAALLGLILTAIFDGEFPVASLILVGTSIAIGIASPWRPRSRGTAQQFVPPAPAPQPRAPMNLPVVPPVPQPAPAVPMEAAPAIPLPAVTPVHSKRVPKAIRAIWLGLFIIAATTGLSMLMVLVADVNHGGSPDEPAMMFGFGTGFMLFAALCLRRARRLHYGGIWDYLFRPMLQVLSFLSITCSGAIIASEHTPHEQNAPAIFMIILGIVVMLVVTFLTKRTVGVALNDPQSALAMSMSRARLEDSFTMTKLFVGFTRFTLNVVGSIVLIAALLIGLASLTNLPGLFASGTLDPEMPARIEEAFGTHNWPNIMLCVGAALSFVLASVAAILLLIPRRHRGASHMFRAFVAIGVLYFSVTAFAKGLPDWANVVRGANPGASIDLYLQMIHRPPLLWGSGMMLFGIFVLLWPAARRNATTINYVNTNVEQPMIAHPAAAQQPVA